MKKLAFAVLSIFLGLIFVATSTAAPVEKSPEIYNWDYYRCNDEVCLWTSSFGFSSKRNHRTVDVFMQKSGKGKFQQILTETSHSRKAISNTLPIRTDFWDSASDLNDFISVGKPGIYQVKLASSKGDKFPFESKPYIFEANQLYYWFNACKDGNKIKMTAVVTYMNGKKPSDTIWVQIGSNESQEAIRMEGDNLCAYYEFYYTPDEYENISWSADDDNWEGEEMATYVSNDRVAASGTFSFPKLRHIENCE